VILAALQRARHVSLGVALAAALAAGCSRRPAPRNEPGVPPRLLAPAAEAAPESSGPGAEAGTDAEPPDAGPGPDGAGPGPVCSDVLDGQLAELSCDRTRVLVAGPIVVPPKYVVPPREARRLLDAVARLLRAHPELQLLRIEAYSSHDPGSEAEPVRREIEASQARADAVFRYLWQHEKISPERLDAVGYGFEPAFAGASQRWPIMLRVVQRAR
jgi:outer membrane protein OmpA-like peptidoglycan-associated protein